MFMIKSQQSRQSLILQCSSFRQSRTRFWNNGRSHLVALILSEIESRNVCENMYKWDSEWGVRWSLVPACFCHLVPGPSHFLPFGPWSQPVFAIWSLVPASFCHLVPIFIKSIPTGTRTKSSRNRTHVIWLVAFFFLILLWHWAWMFFKPTDMRKLTLTV